MQSVAKKLITRIRGNKRGWVFTPKDFLDLGTRQNIDFILHRLVKDNTIRRISRGIYDYPIQHSLLGSLSPTQDAIANAVARANNDTAQVSGAVATNLLGLSTQVPAKSVYATHKTRKTIHVGNRSIQLKPTNSPMDDKNIKVTMVLQALKYLGKDNIDDQVILQCKNLLGINDKHSLLQQTKRVKGDWLANAVRQIAV